MCAVLCHHDTGPQVAVRGCTVDTEAVKVFSIQSWADEERSLCSVGVGAGSGGLRNCHCKNYNIM
jgi:hypothetical protein